MNTGLGVFWIFLALMWAVLSGTVPQSYRYRRGIAIAYAAIALADASLGVMYLLS